MTGYAKAFLAAVAVVSVSVTGCHGRFFTTPIQNDLLGRRVTDVVKLGMSEAEVGAALPQGFRLQYGASRFPEETVIWGRTVPVRYYESHGKHYSVSHPAAGGSPVAWLTFENGKLTRLLRHLGDFRGLRSEEFAKALAGSLERMGAHNPAAATIQVSSWKDQFEIIEFNFGQKQVEVRVLSDNLSLSENLGRGDVEDTSPRP
jgi:hypothetical protein